MEENFCILSRRKKKKSIGITLSVRRWNIPLYKQDLDVPLLMLHAEGGVWSLKKSSRAAREVGASPTRWHVYATFSFKIYFIYVKRPKCSWIYFLITKKPYWNMKTLLKQVKRNKISSVYYAKKDEKYKSPHLIVFLDFILRVTSNSNMQWDD